MNEKNNNQQQGIEKMFTQSDVNRIIGERLSRDKLKGNEELEKRESELMARELKFVAKQLLSEKGLPSELADILKLESEASVTEAVELLSKLVSGNKMESKLKVVNERKLPTGKNDDENYGQLRRAFGLI
ncbi:MAG: hypothetical protein E7508_07360 [Ruminococcus sp.]|nr:hypothetical protein [Ruminococcus sp.]